MFYENHLDNIIIILVLINSTLSIAKFIIKLGKAITKSSKPRKDKLTRNTYK